MLFDFGEISFKNKELSKEVVVENKMVKKIKKHNWKHGSKIANDIEIIKSLVEEIGPDEELNLISKCFDSPNIVLAYVDQIKELFVSTWAITPAGINSFIQIIQNGNATNLNLLMDKTHSYKWIFTSGAYKIMKGNIKIKFGTNHSKFLCMKLHDGSVLNFIGSINFSNSPRYENITINRDHEDYNFYTDFLKICEGETI